MAGTDRVSLLKIRNFADDKIMYLHADVITQLGRHSSIIDKDINLVIEKLSSFVPHLPPALSEHRNFFRFGKILANDVLTLQVYSITQYSIPDIMLLMNLSPVSDVQFTEETALLPIPLLEFSDRLLGRGF